MKKGFTLIELLVVVLIIGVLSAIALPQYTIAVEKSRLSEALINMKNLREQLDLYILANGFPLSNTRPEDMGIAFPGENGESDTKNFGYWVGFTSTDAYVEITRYNPSEVYSLNARRQSGASFWTFSCATQLTDVGRKICKQLEGQGFEYLERVQ